MGYTSDGGFTIDETKGKIKYTVTEDDLKRKPKQEKPKDTDSPGKSGEKDK